MIAPAPSEAEISSFPGELRFIENAFSLVRTAVLSKIKFNGVGRLQAYLRTQRHLPVGEGGLTRMKKQLMFPVQWLPAMNSAVRSNRTLRFSLRGVARRCIAIAWCRNAQTSDLIAGTGCQYTPISESAFGVATTLESNLEGSV